MTVSVLIRRNFEVSGSRRLHHKPQSLESLTAAQKVVDYRLSLLEKQIEQLRDEHAREFSKRQVLVKEIQANSYNPIDKLPLSYIASFLTSADTCSLSSVCSHFRTELTTNGLIIPNLYIRKAEAKASSIAKLARDLECGSVISLRIDARLDSNAHLLYFLAQRASKLINLRSFSITGKTVNTDLQNSLLLFFENLPRDVLEELHMSGIRRLTTIGKVVTTQAASLRNLKIDYLASGHSTEVNSDILPIMPKIESLYFDVADLSEAPVSLLSGIFRAVQDKSQLKVVYLPHVELIGEQESFRRLLRELEEFTMLGQVVLRFHALFIPLEDIYDLRRSLAHLPAFNISRQFLIALEEWAPWWPPIEKVWASPSAVTGRTVYKEQIDFSSFGASGDREWLRLPRRDKDLWNNCIAPDVERFFVETRTHSHHN